jgi:signal transduction histidine kinase
VYVSHEISLRAEPKRLLWLRHSLARQFILVAFGVLLVGMFTLGTWVAKRIESGVAEIAAASAALYLNSLLAPHLQELASGNSLSVSRMETLNRAIEGAASRMNITSIKIWKENGLVIYSTDKELVGRIFPNKPSLIRAWDGMIAAEFVNHHYAENAGERASGLPQLEVYAPVREISSGNVIAVLEFYEHTESLEAHLSEAEWHSWAMTALVTVAMMTALFSIVANGSRTIDQQRISLTQRVSQLSDLLRQNETLRSRVERAARKATEDNERFIRRLGYDLHDGPAQLIGLALLRLDALSLTGDNGDNLVAIRSALSDALGDIRDFCAGLLLPEVQGLTLREALLFIARDHERRTGSVVRCDITDMPVNSPQFVKICLCRFIQEGLNNAFRHAGGEGQQVFAHWDLKTITIEVVDEGPGMRAPDKGGERLRLGLTGLWDRIESIGGAMTVESTPGEGTRLTARLPLTIGESDEN